MNKGSGKFRNSSFLRLFRGVGAQAVNYKRIPGEPETCYVYFLDYVDLPKPRRLDLLIPKIGKSLSYIKKMSAAWHWRKRARVYDSAVLERTLEGNLRGVEKAAAKEVVSRRQRISDLVDKILRHIDANFDDYHPNTVTRLLADLLKVSASKEELLIKIEEQKDALDLTILSNEEFGQLERISKKLRKENV